MVDKRARKMRGLARELGPPRKIGNPESEFLLVGWGSNYGPMAEAIEILNQDGVSVGGIHLNDLWPFPTEQMTEILSGGQKWAGVESNATGQLARLIQMETQKKPEGMILKYNGRPFMPGEIVEGFRREVVDR